MPEQSTKELEDKGCKPIKDKAGNEIQVCVGTGKDMGRRGLVGRGIKNVA